MASKIPTEIASTFYTGLAPPPPTEIASTSISDITTPSDIIPLSPLPTPPAGLFQHLINTPVESRGWVAFVAAHCHLQDHAEFYRVVMRLAATAVGVGDIR